MRLEIYCKENDMMQQTIRAYSDSITDLNTQLDKKNRE